MALQLTSHDALGAHARDELGINEIMNARPVQAAIASAGTFALGALLPLLVAMDDARTTSCNWRCDDVDTIFSIVRHISCKGSGAGCGKVHFV